MGDPSWYDRAACKRSAHHGLSFFPEGAEGGGATPGMKRAVDLALAYCAMCPVRTECGEYALGHKIDHGIWGGMTTHQRKKIRKQRRQAAA